MKIDQCYGQLFKNSKFLDFIDFYFILSESYSLNKQFLYKMLL